MLRPHSWDDFTNPMLVLTGTNDDSDRTGDDWVWRLDPYTHAPAGFKHLVVLGGAYHDFSGISGASYPGQGPPNDDHVLQVRSATTAFFDAYVKGSEAARAWLASDAMTEATAGSVDVDGKQELRGGARRQSRAERSRAERSGPSPVAYRSARLT